MKQKAHFELETRTRTHVHTTQSQILISNLIWKKNGAVHNQYLCSRKTIPSISHKKRSNQPLPSLKFPIIHIIVSVLN